MKAQFARWRADFLAGLAVALPGIISVAVVMWLFNTVSNITDTLLFFLPTHWTHQRGGEGPMYWYWSWCAFLLAVLLVTLLGRLARYYFGRQLIWLMDQLLSSVPLLNKVYGTVKQVNDAFSSGKKSSFKQVVIIEYPRPGVYTVGFVTSDEHREAEARLGRKLLGVFVPTTPNPTSGFLLLVPETEVIPLAMSVADGIKYIISLGAIVPEYSSDAEPAALPVLPAPVLPPLP